jgi:preprotein translocase subunit SecY
MKNFFSSLKKASSIPALRKKLLYTLFFVAIYRFGNFFVLPWINAGKVFEVQKNNVADFWDSLLGTSLNTFSVFSLGITPYISASIIIQLAGFVLPSFQRLQQEGMTGRAKLNRLTRYLAVVMAIIQAIVRARGIDKGYLLIDEKGSYFWFYFFAVLLMAAGSVFSIWLADLITEKGLGNGTSILIMAGIISRLVPALITEIREQRGFMLLVGLLVFTAIVFATIVFMKGVRKVGLQYARQMTSMYSYGEGRQYLPIKINATGVMPIIFASVFVGFLTFISKVLYEKFEWAFAGKIHDVFKDAYGWKCNAVKALLIFLGTIMYAAVFINPVKIANELKQNNGFISGVKPGHSTAQYIDKVMSRILLPGALFLAIVALFPSVVYWEGNGLVKTAEFSQFYGGTSMLIIIGVIMEMVQQVEGHLNMVYYDSILQEKEHLPNL